MTKHWRAVKENYKLLKVLGAGTFGKVVLAKHRTTKQEVAIKFIATTFDKQSECRNVLRELSILRQLTAMKENIFTSKLKEVVVASDDKTTLKGA